MRDLKYIIIDVGGGMLTAILFNGMIPHSFIWDGLKDLNYKLISAGSCVITNYPEVKAFGHSNSLEITSAEGDSEIITRTLQRTIML